MSVRVLPRASRTELVGVHGLSVKLRVAAPPVGGAANEAVTKFIADRCGVPAGDVALLMGAMSRHKLLLVRGRDAAAVGHALDVDLEGGS